MSSSRQNPYPWPKIANVSSTISFRVGCLMKSFDAAQQLIATAWRHHRLAPHHERHVAADQWMNLFREFRGQRLAGRLHSSQGFHTYFASLPCVASQKYDGTNVGVSEEGLMLGRRLVIPADAKSYQSTPLTEVRAALAEVSAVKAALLPDAADREHLHCTVYGELMCNSRRFDYSERGLGGAFACFGVMLRGNQLVDGSDLDIDRVVARMTAAGFETAVTKNLLGVAAGEPAEVRAAAAKAPGAKFQVQLKLMMCPTLRKVFEARGLRVVAPAVHAPLLHVVNQLTPWMMSGEGEGVVLTIGSHGGDKGGLVKWKTAVEGQGGTPELLLGASRMLKERGQHPPQAATRGAATAATAVAAAVPRVQLVDPAVVALVDTMHAVSVSDCNGRSSKAVAARARAKKAAKQAASKAPPAVSDDELRAAYESALTKFDALEDWFASGATMKEVSQTLLKEVAVDLGCYSEDATQPAKKNKNKAKQPAAGGGGGGAGGGADGAAAAEEQCEFAFGKVKSFRRCGCRQCTRQLEKQACVRTYVMRLVGSSFGAWKVRSKGD